MSIPLEIEALIKKLSQELTFIEQETTEGINLLRSLPTVTCRLRPFRAE